MMTVRQGGARGRGSHGWLDARHSFSFADYQDPAHMGFSDLRVLNEDRIAPSSGFAEHPHRDMEILTWVLEGTLSHRDSTGSTGELVAGDAQVITAGSGIRHSETNRDPAHGVHLLQIWILPWSRDLPPAHAQRSFSMEARRDRLCPVAVPATSADDGGALRIHQDVLVHACNLSAGKTVVWQPGRKRAAWLQLVRGCLGVGGHLLVAGDGLAVQDEDILAIAGQEEAEFLLLDLRPVDAVRP